MADKKSLHLFEGYGIELEYMIVHKDTLAVLPIADEVIRSVAGEYVNDTEYEGTGWSNELALHVIELKTLAPPPSLDGLPEKFYQSCRHINSILTKHNAQLMPTAMHPFMNPIQEMKLWPHEYSPIYEAYNRIFDTKGHGWANLQSTHINLPFATDEEFGRLHAAIRLVLPLIPALAASSPIADGRNTGFKDYRLEVYRKNQIRVPSIAGKVIPEAVFSIQGYEEDILQKMYRDIAPHDPEEILQEEWLNSRGAIARFERNTIEIRLIDIQECPIADMSVAAFVIEVVKALVSERWSAWQEQQQPGEDQLAAILLKNISMAESNVIDDEAYLRLFGVGRKMTAGQLWQYLFDQCMSGGDKRQWMGALKTILEKGTLSSRILAALRSDLSLPSFKRVYGRLCECLSENTMFLADAQ